MKSVITSRPKAPQLSAGVVVLTFTLMIAACSFAQGQRTDQVSAGLWTWKTSGCADCHGPFADGDREDDDFPIGANLRTTKLEAAALKTTIRCGRAGTGMPAFEDGAYVTNSCYGRPLGSAPENLEPSSRKLTADEIDAVIAYLQARIIGRGRITRQECLAYYDDQPDSCEDYK
jgi:mono/diheme cytochrome c family protein